MAGQATLVEGIEDALTIAQLVRRDKRPCTRPAPEVPGTSAGLHCSETTRDRSVSARHSVADPASHRSLVHQVGFYPHVNSQMFLRIVLFCLGFPDRALALSNAALAEARTLAHPPTVAGSLAIN